MQLQLLTYRILVERQRPTTAELVTTYNQLADRWQTKIQRLGFDHAYRDLLTRLQAGRVFTSITADSAVLDAGIGSGALSLALHQVQPTGWQLHGVDIASGMLTKAAELLQPQGLPFRLYKDDVSHLPFPDNRFDLVMSAHTLEHLVQPVVGLQELARVLRPGAPLLLIITRRSWLSRWLDARWCLHTVSPTALTGWLTGIGLRHVTLYELNGPFWCRHLSLAAIGWKT